MKIISLDKSHSVTYGLDVYQLRLKFKNSKDVEVFIWLQLVIGEQPESIDESYDITLINMTNETNFYLPCTIRDWIKDCIQDFFKKNPEIDLTFRIESNFGRNYLRIIKFLSFLNFYDKDFDYTITLINARTVYEVNIRPKQTT